MEYLSNFVLNSIPYSLDLYGIERARAIHNRSQSNIYYNASNISPWQRLYRGKLKRPISPQKGRCKNREEVALMYDD